MDGPADSPTPNSESSVRAVCVNAHVRICAGAVSDVLPRQAAELICATITDSATRPSAARFRSTNLKAPAS